MPSDAFWGTARSQTSIQVSRKRFEPVFHHHPITNFRSAIFDFLRTFWIGINACGEPSITSRWTIYSMVLYSSFCASVPFFVFGSAEKYYHWIRSGLTSCFSNSNALSNSSAESRSTSRSGDRSREDSGAELTPS